MGYFAKINKRNNVTEVIVADQEHIDKIKVVSEAVEAQEAVYDTWIETKMDGSVRKNYAGVGYHYDEAKDAFIPPKPFNSWVLNDDTCQWEAPVDYPSDGKDYRWDENTTNWVEV